MTRFLAAVLLAGAHLAAAAKPGSAHSPDEVQALVERAAEHIRVVGREQAFADFDRPDGGFVDGELYIFCDAADGAVLAHGDNPKLVGKNLLSVRDAEGNFPTAEVFRLAEAKGRGWIEYLWPNKKEGRIQRKVAYVILVDDRTVCGSGYYKPDKP